MNNIIKTIMGIAIQPDSIKLLIENPPKFGKTYSLETELKIIKMINIAIKIPNITPILITPKFFYSIFFIYVTLYFFPNSLAKKPFFGSFASCCPGSLRVSAGLNL